MIQLIARPPCGRAFFVFLINFTFCAQFSGGRFRYKYQPTPKTTMIQQAHTLPARPAVSIEATAAFDVLWGKPLFRAPNLPAPVIAPVVAPFTGHPVAAPRRQAK